MTVLTPAARAEWRDAGRLVVAGVAWVLFAAGWLCAKGLRSAGTAVAAVFFGAGWVSGRVVWPAACWAGRAARLGWDEGRRPLGARAPA